jgi:hypothetical protein
LRHLSAAARTVILASARASTHTSSPHHVALHGNAFNPDTGKLAEYHELSKCSEGPFWQRSNADEIGRLAQGHGDQKGTKTMYFIKVTNIPKGRTATYLCVVAAMQPEKANPRRVPPSAAIASTILTTSAPKPLISPPPNFSSTAPSQRQMHAT